MYVRIAGRLLLNCQSLNAQGGGGTNYVEITKVKIPIRKGDSWSLIEVPAISGNMVKHWHFVGFVESFKRLTKGNNFYKYKDNISKRALRWNAVRFVGGEEAKANGKTIDLKDEATIIKNFADADVHGFLAPGKGIRRLSLIKTSFMIPTEDFLEDLHESPTYTIKHNRVDVSEEGKIQGGEETAQMIFNREYASAPYGFSIVLDLGMVGVPQSDPIKKNGESGKVEPNKVIDVDEINLRKIAAIEALEYLLSGNLGANLARSFPIIKLESFIAIASNDPIPSLIHGYFKDFEEENANILRGIIKRYTDIEIYATPGIAKKIEKELGQDKVKIVNTISELVDQLKNKILSDKSPK